jgi:hypothetical protein
MTCSTKTAGSSPKPRSRAFIPSARRSTTHQPAARKQYWANANTALFQKGVDAWWLDTDEPETEGREDNILTTNKIYLGSGARYANIYPLFHTNRLRRPARPQRKTKRVFILRVQPTRARSATASPPGPATCSPTG